MRDEDLRAVLAMELELGTSEEPKHPVTIAHDEYREYVAYCPECDEQVRPNRDWAVEDKVVYLPVSFCPICGTPIDWTGVISEEELEDTDEC